MNPYCNDCGKCCLNTEMVISRSDVINICKVSSDNLLEEDFSKFNEDKLRQLVNIDGACFFFNIKSKTCKIYDNRPQGCYFYPLIYDSSKDQCIFDDDCPRADLFYQKKGEPENLCREIKDFIRNDLKMEK